MAMATENEQAPEELLRLRARDSLLTNIQLRDPEFTASDFHRFLGSILEDVFDSIGPTAPKDLKRVILSVPPRHGKSRMTAVEFVAWAIGKRPELKVALVSHSGELATDSAVEARDICGSEEHKTVFPELKLSKHTKKKNDWQTSVQGRYLAVGTTGSLTGRGCDVLIVDDPFKDYATAHSASEREKIWNWYWSTGRTRLAPGGVVIIIMTRWHKDDLVGRFLDPVRQAEIRSRLEEANIDPDREAWEEIILPAIAEEDDPMGRKQGEALDPIRWPIEELRLIEATFLDYVYTAMYRQKPVLKGGNYCKLEWLQHINLDEVPLEGLRWVRFWDTATGEKEENDFTAGARCCMDQESNFYIVNILKGKWRWPTARERIAETAKQEDHIIAMESVGGFEAARQNLVEVLPSRIQCPAITVHKDKLTRSLAWFAAAKEGKVFVIRGPWVPDFEMELEAFPASPNDDQMDAVSGAFNFLATEARAPIPTTFPSRRGQAANRRKDRSYA